MPRQRHKRTQPKAAPSAPQDERPYRSKHMENGEKMWVCTKCDYWTEISHEVMKAHVAEQHGEPRQRQQRG